MASLLVRVERGVLDAIRARARDGRAELAPGDLPHPELAHLDRGGVVFVVWLDGATLRCGLTVHEPELAGGRLIGGDALLHDHDLTPLLERLGCGADVAGWSARAHLLPPNDVDLLHYALALPLDPRRNLVLEPTVLAREDEQDRELLTQIWANPESDVPRMIYADLLQQRADPRGELIALQLARGDGRRTERERELLTRWGAQCTRPLANFLAGYELRRGFLGAAIVDERQYVPPALIEHPMWGLVEQLQTSHTTLLLQAPLTSVRVLRLTGRIAAYLAAYPRTWPKVSHLLGEELPQGRYRGLALHDLAAWQRLGASTVWPAVRVLSMDLASRLHGLAPFIVLRSALGAQLTHLDVTIDVTSPSLDPHTLFGELARNPTIQQLTLLLGGFDPTLREPLGLSYVRTAANTFELVLQLPPYGPVALRAAVDWIEMFSRGIERLRVRRVEVPGRTRAPADEAAFLEWLSQAVPATAFVDDAPLLCPWAYPSSAALPSTLRL